MDFRLFNSAKNRIPTCNGQINTKRWLISLMVKDSNPITCSVPLHFTKTFAFYSSAIFEPNFLNQQFTIKNYYYALIRSCGSYPVNAKAPINPLLNPPFSLRRLVLKFCCKCRQQKFTFNDDFDAGQSISL